MHSQPNGSLLIGLNEKDIWGMIHSAPLLDNKGYSEMIREISKSQGQSLPVTKMRCVSGS